MQGRGVFEGGNDCNSALNGFRANLAKQNKKKKVIPKKTGGGNGELKGLMHHGCERDAK